MNKQDNICKRAARIMDIAIRMSSKMGWQVQNYIEEIQLHYNGYGEPGYSDPDCGLIATGNWNDVTVYDKQTQSRKVVSDLPQRISDLFEKIGIPCEWLDEWSECGNCGKLIRTEADSYCWLPSYKLYDGDISCEECLKADPESYLSSLEDNPDDANTFSSIDPADYDYVKLDEDFETGWFPGQTDSPHKVAKELRDKGVSRYLFNIDNTGQFDTHWSCFIHADEIEMLKEADNEKEDLVKTTCDVIVNKPIEVKPVCSECNGTGIVDKGFYTRTCACKLGQEIDMIRLSLATLVILSSTDNDAKEAKQVWLNLDRANLQDPPVIVAAHYNANNNSISAGLIWDDYFGAQER